MIECFYRYLMVLHYILVTEMIYANNASKIIFTSTAGQCDSIKWASAP